MNLSTLHKSKLINSIIAVFIVERVGRRPLLILSTITIGITMVVLAGMYNLTQQDNFAAQVTSIIMVMLYLLFFGVGWLPIPWLYPAEINPIR
jgi:MFS family permease